MKKWLVRIALGLLVAALLFAGYAVYQLRSRGFLRSPVYESVAPELPALGHPAVLVFSKTNAFIHKEAIPAAADMFRALAAKNGWSVYVTENGAVHNPADLARFDTVVWNNVTGDVLTTAQRRALREYIENGGGWLGIHGSGDSSSDWDWYKQTLVGAIFTDHPYPHQFQRATLHIEHRDDPIVAHLGGEWQRTDEWYSFAASPRGPGVDILATVDEATYDPTFMDRDIRMGADHPVIWKHCQGRGRALYSALGHTAESYSEPAYVTLLEHAVRWTAGLEGAPCPAG